jgi:hypothetical protein
LLYHTFDSQHSAAGFPDLVMARGRRLVAAELKTERPSDWPEIERVLR